MTTPVMVGENGPELIASLSNPDRLPDTRFKFFSGILKASRSADGKLRLHGVASSTTKDLHGDVMTTSAIDDMEQAANNNLTIFLNHSYNVPEDVGGSVEKAVSRTRGVDHEGNPNVDLEFDVRLNEANPRAVSTFEAIERGTKLGLSIGAMLPEGGYKRNKDGTYIIEHVELLETSLVGIPANPRSWVEYAAKALRGGDNPLLALAEPLRRDATSVPLGEPTLTLDGNSYKIEGKFDNSKVGVTAGTPVEVIHEGGCNDKCVGDVHYLEGVEPETTDTQAAEPGKTDATVTIIQIDTGDGSSDGSDSDSDDDGSMQEALSSDPEHVAANATPDPATAVAATSDPSVTAEFAQLVELLRSTTTDLVAARSSIAQLTSERDEAVRTRDAAVEERTRVLRETKRVLDMVADAPLVRRAVAVEAKREFSQTFSGMYSDDFLKMLES